MTTYYVDGAVGNDANAGTSAGSGNAWATIDKAMNTVVAGDVVYVKASATYSELATIDTYGSATAGIMFIGYTSTTTDEGKATISGGGSRTNCVTSSVGNGNMYYLFANFIFDNATGDGFDTVGGDNIAFVNCEFTNNGDRGFQGDNFVSFIKCSFAGNTTSAFDLDGPGNVMACSINCNGAGGVFMNDGAVILTEIFNIGASDYGIRTTGNLMTHVCNVTIDGENAASTTGLEFASAAYDIPSVCNTIFHDVNTAISVVANLNNVLSVVNTIFSSVNTEYGTNTGRYETGKSTSAPGFTNEASDDYTIAAAGAAEDAGIDASDA